MTVIAAEPERYAVYYSDELPSAALADYDLVIMDSDYHPPLYPLKKRGVTTLGYISLGEVEKHRSWYDAVKAEGILLQENKYWPDSYYVDMRTDLWQKRVINELIPAILAEGFDGVFFDTLDNPAELEDTEPETYKGMKDGAVRLVKAIRKAFPGVPLMMNRGYALLPQVSEDIDMVMAECLYSDYDFENKTYSKVDEDIHTYDLDQISRARARTPSLKIYSLDYWPTDDTETIARIYDYQRSHGFIPYVSTIALDKLVPEPKTKSHNKNNGSMVQ